MAMTMKKKKFEKFKTLLDLVNYDGSDMLTPESKRQALIMTNLAIARIAMMRVEKLLDEKIETEQIGNEHVKISKHIHGAK